MVTAIWGLFIISILILIANITIILMLLADWLDQ